MKKPVLGLKWAKHWENCRLQAMPLQLLSPCHIHWKTLFTVMIDAPDIPRCGPGFSTKYASYNNNPMCKYHHLWSRHHEQLIAHNCTHLKHVIVPRSGPCCTRSSGYMYPASSLLPGARPGCLRYATKYVLAPRNHTYVWSMVYSVHTDYGVLGLPCYWSSCHMRLVAG